MKMFSVTLIDDGRHLGYELPYGKLAEKPTFLAGEISPCSGTAGHGKSQILSDGIAHWIKQGSRT